MKFLTHKTNGFTLIETLVAITIFSTSLIGLMTIASQGISASRNAKHSLEAQLLAQEGIEFVHNLRDNAFLAGSSQGNWTAVFGSCLDSVRPCIVDYGNFELDLCLDGLCKIYKDTNDQYTQTDTDEEETIFARKIWLKSIPGDAKEITAEAIVEWKDGNLTRDISVKENLLLWQ